MFIVLKIFLILLKVVNGLDDLKDYKVDINVKGADESNADYNKTLTVSKFDENQASEVFENLEPGNYYITGNY